MEDTRTYSLTLLNSEMDTLGFICCWARNYIIWNNNPFKQNTVISPEPSTSVYFRWHCALLFLSVICMTAQYMSAIMAYYLVFIHCMWIKT
jgi:hypothetical protein